MFPLQNLQVLPHQDLLHQILNKHQKWPRIKISQAWIKRPNKKRNSNKKKEFLQSNKINNNHNLLAFLQARSLSLTQKIIKRLRKKGKNKKDSRQAKANKKVLMNHNHQIPNFRILLSNLVLMQEKKETHHQTKDQGRSQKTKKDNLQVHLPQMEAKTEDVKNPLRNRQEEDDSIYGFYKDNFLLISYIYNIVSMMQL